MIVGGALGNILLDGQLRAWLATSDIEAALRAVIVPEVFGARE